VTGTLFRRNVVRSCSFCRATLDGISARRTDFFECRFEAVEFGSRQLGIFSDCRFERCTFLGCRFDGVVFRKDTLSACRFEEITARKALWESCSFVDIVISGAIRSSNLRACTFTGADFTGVHFSDCALIDGSAEGVRLPDQPDNFAITGALLSRASEPLRKALSDEAMSVYERTARTFAKSAARLLVDDSFFEDLNEGDRRIVMTTLYGLRVAS
jgi:uncharacterized protein YjbI with pentapeptide repeats